MVQVEFRQEFSNGFHMSGVFPRYRNYFSEDVTNLRSPPSVHAATFHPPPSEEERRVKRAGLCSPQHVSDAIQAAQSVLHYLFIGHARQVLTMPAMRPCP
jgi:hypothetical protein